MNTATARQLSAKIAELIELASIFQARYGKQYRIKPGSPAEAWELHQAIFDQQASIAAMLDGTALDNPLRRCPPWWKYQETVDTGTASLIAAEVCHLIACCASFEAEPRATSSPVIETSQAAIAGMLHPSAVLVAQGAQGAPEYARRAS